MKQEIKMTLELKDVFAIIRQAQYLNKIKVARAPIDRMVEAKIIQQACKSREVKDALCEEFACTYKQIEDFYLA